MLSSNETYYIEELFFLDLKKQYGSTILCRTKTKSKILISIKKNKMNSATANATFEEQFLCK